MDHGSPFPPPPQAEHSFLKVPGISGRRVHPQSSQLTHTEQDLSLTSSLQGLGLTLGVCAVRGGEGQARSHVACVQAALPAAGSAILGELLQSGLSLLFVKRWCRDIAQLTELTASPALFPRFISPSL